MAAMEEQEYNKPFSFKIWKGLFPFLKPYRAPLFLIVALNMFSALIDIVMPLFQRYAIDNFIEAETTDHLWAFGLTYGAVILVQALGVVIFASKAMYVEMSLGRDLKRACFVHLQTLSFSYYNVTPVGYLLARVMSDTNRIAGTTAWGLVDVLWALCYVIGVFIAMFAVDWKLALLTLVMLPVGVWAVMMMTRAGFAKMDSYYRSAQVMNNTIIEYVNGMEVVKVFGRDGAFVVVGGRTRGSRGRSRGIRRTVSDCGRSSARRTARF